MIVTAVLMMKARFSHTGMVCGGHYLSGEERTDEEKETYDIELGQMVGFFGIVHVVILGTIFTALIIMSIIYCIRGPEYFKKKEDQVDETVQNQNLL